LAFALSIGPAPGAQSGQHTVKVEARVEPMIAVGAPSDYKFLGRIGSGAHGRICAVIPFTVQANTPGVRLQVSATHLYKGGSAAAPFIPLVLGEPPEVISDVTQVGSPDNVLPWSAEPYTSHGLPGLCTEPREFVCGRETFQADVDVKVCWQNNNPELPTGNYVGYVKLRAEVVPP
jgi:hypothetical protein